MLVCPLDTMRPNPPPYMCRPYRPHNAKGTIVRPLAKCYETSRFYPVPFRLLYTMVAKVHRRRDIAHARSRCTRTYPHMWRLPPLADSRNASQ